MASQHTHGGHEHNQRRVLWALLLTGGFMVAEVIGGLLSGSLALLADAGHMLTDSAALALSWYAGETTAASFHSPWHPGAPGRLGARSGSLGRAREPELRLVPWACAAGQAWALHMATVGLLLVAAAGGLVSWRSFNRLSRHGADDRTRSRRFLARGLGYRRHFVPGNPPGVAPELYPGPVSGGGMRSEH